jgi:hypothetical protein
MQRKGIISPNKSQQQSNSKNYTKLNRNNIKGKNKKRNAEINEEI